MHGESAPKAPPFADAEGVDERFFAVGVEVVHHEVNRDGFRVALCEKPEARGKVECRAAPGYSDKVPPALRVRHHEQVRRALAPVLVVSAKHASDPAGCTHFFPQFHPFLVQADDGKACVVRLFVQPHHIRHPLDVLVIECGDAPHFFPATA
jgi:hypothetical protein